MQVSGFSGSSVSFIRQFNSTWFAKHIAVTEVDKFVCTSKWKRESRFNFEPMRADSAISDGSGNQLSLRFFPFGFFAAFFFGSESRAAFFFASFACDSSVFSSSSDRAKCSSTVRESLKSEV